MSGGGAGAEGGTHSPEAQHLVSPGPLSLWGPPCSSTVSLYAGIAAALNGTAANVSLYSGTGPYDWSGPGDLADAVAAAAAADVTILALGLGCAVETEGVDRPNLTLPYVQVRGRAGVSRYCSGSRQPPLPLPVPCQDALLYAVAAAVPPSGRLILVIESAGLVDVDPALADAILQVRRRGGGGGVVCCCQHRRCYSLPSVLRLQQLFIIGEEAGHALADILFGAVSPSARLPITGYRQEYLELAGPVADVSRAGGWAHGYFSGHCSYLPPSRYRRSSTSSRTRSVSAAPSATPTAYRPTSSGGASVSASPLRPGPTVT